MSKSKLFQDLFTFVFSLSLLAFLVYGFIDFYAYQRFKPNIAECRGMNEVKVIAAGRLKRPNEKIIPFGNNRKIDKDELLPPPKSIYTFKSEKAYQGIYPKVRGNKRTGFNFMIREDEAPQGALGKRALICVGGFRPRTLEAIYIEQ